MKLFLVLLLLVHLVVGVDRGKFKTCDQSSFCRRNRGLLGNKSDYQYTLSNVRKEGDSKLVGEFKSSIVGHPLQLELVSIYK